jgi:2-polyprenyl-3-methyl-5-hydroxy-6-metoxy-1,4-benzoquinol methylase
VSGCVFCGGSTSTLVFRGSDRLYRQTTKSFDVLQCSNCGLIRLSPRPCAEELTSYYPDSYWFGTGKGARSRLHNQCRRLLLRDHLAFLKDISGTVLDVGCGGGLLLTMLRERGVNAIGLDLSLGAARAALEHGAPVVCGSLNDAPFAPGSFKVITMYHVLEHVSDPVRYLQAARSLLAGRGRLIIQVPNAASWQARFFRQKWNGFDVPRHLHTFRESDLLHMLTCSGFEVVRRKYFSLRDNPAGFVTSVAPGLDPMVRRIRRQRTASFAHDMTYLTLAIAALPFAFLEACCRKGATITIEAAKKPG